MPEYWMEDYESTSSADPFMDDIIKRCEQIIDKKGFVRIGYVILDDHPPQKVVLK